MTEDARMRPVERLLIVGAGLMGSGIAQVAALAGKAVILTDFDPALGAAQERIATSFGRLVRRGTLTSEQREAASARVETTTDTEGAACDADLVIEAIIENLQAKQSLFAMLDKVCAPDVVLATNTSQFQIGRIAQPCVHGARVIGMHWSNPPILMRLVEVILSADTSPATLEVAEDFIRSCDREFVVCRKDVPGFISNRLSTVLFMEGARLVDEEIATPAEIDSVARLMFGHRMGPLETLDLAGLDTALAASRALAAHYGGDRFTPPPVLSRLVDEGRLGRKSGSGFYTESK
jgi:3-hydroxybutyryl-CoA dehydrogenase